MGCVLRRLLARLLPWTVAVEYVQPWPCLQRHPVLVFAREPDRRQPTRLYGLCGDRRVHGGPEVEDAICAELQPQPGTSVVEQCCGAGWICRICGTKAVPLPRHQPA